MPRLESNAGEINEADASLGFDDGPGVCALVAAMPLSAAIVKAVPRTINGRSIQQRIPIPSPFRPLVMLPHFNDECARGRRLPASRQEKPGHLQRRADDSLSRTELSRY